MADLEKDLTVIPSTTLKTVDTHTHLLSSAVRFDRPFDRLMLRLFGRRLGMDPRNLKENPWENYVTTLARVVQQSAFVEKTCLFGVDGQVDDEGKEVARDRTVCASNEDLLEVVRRYPDRFIPFFSINPLRPDALEQMDACVEAGCQGAKFLQNYWGIDLNDPRLIPYYERLKRYRLPLIIHLGSEFAITSERSLEGVEMLELPLATGVTVIAAHMGLGQINHRLFPWRNLSRNPAWFDRDYFRLLEMLEKHVNLYADLAAMLIPLRARALPHLAAQHQIHHKLLFGSDYPVPFLVRFNTHGLPRETVARIARITNPLDRYVSVLLEFFPQKNPLWSNYRKILHTKEKKAAGSKLPAAREGV